MYDNVENYLFIVPFCVVVVVEEEERENIRKKNLKNEQKTSLY
jgi:hypothetical protein